MVLLKIRSLSSPISIPEDSSSGRISLTDKDEISKTASTKALSCPALIRSFEDFPPRIRLIASTSKDLPAPVSPEITLRPEAGSKTALDITAKLSISSLISKTRYLLYVI